MKQMIAGVIVAALVGCGGTKGKPEEPTLGTTHAPPVEEDDPAAAAPATQGEPGEEPEPPDAEMPVPPEPQVPVRFELKNEGKGELVFALDKGWTAAIFAYSGKPPKARSVLLYPKWCTETCDAQGDAVCPTCKIEEDPKKRQQQEEEETRREVVAGGATFVLDWDGQVFQYEPAPSAARKKKKKCECWRKVPPPAETYTIKACGLRMASGAGRTSKMQCAEAQVVLPAPAGTVVTLAFP